MKYEVTKINRMGETIKTVETDSKAKANGIATAWFLNKDRHEDVRIYEIHGETKTRIY